MLTGHPEDGSHGGGPIERHGHGDRPATAESLAHGRSGNGAQLAVNGIGEGDLPVPRALASVLYSLGQNEQRAYGEKREQQNYHSRQ